jgi:hypothetical protein
VCIQCTLLALCQSGIQLYWQSTALTV